MSNSDSVYSIRFIAKDESSGYFIIYCAIFDSLNGKFDLFEVLVSNQTSFSKISHNSTFKDCSNFIQGVKYKGEFTQNYTNSLNDGYKSLSTSENFTTELTHYLEHNDQEKISYLLKQPLIQTMGIGAKIEMNLACDKISKDEIEKVSISEEAPSENTSIIPPGSMVVNFKFTLSPVSGVKVSELKVGTRVMVKVIQGDQNSNNAINLLKLRDETGNVKIIPATIVHILHNPNSTETIIKITDSIFGKYTEEESSIKVKLAGQETLSTVQKQAETKKQPLHQPKIEPADSSSMPITILIALGVLGVIGAFVVIFLL